MGLFYLKEGPGDVWSPHIDKNIEAIEMDQRSAAWWVSNQYSSYDSVSAMLSNLGWRSVEYRCYDSQIAMLYKIQYGLVAVQMPSYFEHPKRIECRTKSPLTESPPPPPLFFVDEDRIPQVHLANRTESPPLPVRISIIILLHFTAIIALKSFFIHCLLMIG